jgi:CAI-1 autoinducer synthase
VPASAHQQDPPRYPPWLTEQVAPHCDFIAGLTPFPFDQPADITGYLSLHQNDYLRLADHHDVVQARAEVNGSARAESFSSSVFGGTSRVQEAFMQALARSLEAPRVLLTTGGWAANVGLLEAITSPATPVYLDAEAHASLDDGVRLAHARHVMVRHNDPEHLEKRLSVHGAGVVCIDALYSTDGSIPDLPRYIDVVERHGCALVLDEAHSFGMFGRGGGGLAVSLGLADRVHFRTLSLSKALGGHGGAVAASEYMIRALMTRMRSVVFSSATSTILAAGHHAALTIVEREPERAARAVALGRRLSAQLKAAGIDTRGSDSQIVAVFLESEQDACALYGRLRAERILSSVFVYPAVPRGMGLVRFSVYSDLTEADIDHVAACTTRSVAGLRYLQVKA